MNPSHSPVSPLEPSSPFNPPGPTASSTTLVPFTVQTPNLSNRSWLPFTFKWYFLLLPSITSLSLGIVISVLIWYSQTHHGLGADDGSSAILFGWRFMPTLLAVLYTQLTVILFEDAKRTEPFARLAKAPLQGASALGTVLQTPRAWWSVFKDVLFKRKAVGSTSWCLICAALINIMALLAISPLSSALLTSEEVLMSKPIDFTRILPQEGSQLPLSADRETYFRTMAALMRNISTSAWITDSSLTLPFWPSSEKSQLGPEFQSSPGTWQADTTTLYSSFACEAMKLESAEMSLMRYSGAFDVTGKGPYNGTQPMVSFVLTSGDACRYNLSIHPGAHLAYNGGLTWSNTSTFYHIHRETLSISSIPFGSNVSANSPYARVNASKECRDRDIIILATPWTKPIQLENPSNHALAKNQTYERSPDFKMKGFLCESRYTMKAHAVTASISATTQTIIYNASSTNDSVKTVSSTLVDLAKFQALALQDDWRMYFNKDAINKDADKGLNGQSADYDVYKRQITPIFSGMGPLLGAIYSFNIPAMLEDNHFVDQAARAKGRFYTESLRQALTLSEALRSEKITGQTIVVEERVMVLKEIGITLAVLFLVSFLLIILVFFCSRLSHRPLNLSTDPGSTVGLSLLLHPQQARSSTFKLMHSETNENLHTILRKESFYTLNGVLHESSVSQPTPAKAQTQSNSSKTWKPLVIRLRMLFALACFLLLILAAVFTLNAFSMQSRLSQVAFIYELDVSKLGLSFSTFAPISIAPTLLSVLIGLWWDQLDMTLRILQPYISMAQKPTPISRGAGLTYRSKTWIGAAIKAARNKHFLLFAIAIGSVFCQILTVSMSALFERRPANVEQTVILNATLNMRQGPVITKIAARSALGDSRRLRHTWKVLDELYVDPPKNWLAGAAIQLSLNGSQPPWTSDDWSFIPLDLSTIEVSDPSKDTESSLMHSSNVTVHTTGIRARLECTPIDTSNTSSWLINPDIDRLDSGFDIEGFEEYYTLNNTIFNSTPSNTSIFATKNLIQCCSNGSNEDPRTAAIGYWSPTNVESFPHTDKKWPLPFITKIILGEPMRLNEKNYDPEITSRYWETVMLYKDKPSIQAARCLPVIESAKATVSLDQSTAAVISYKIVEQVLPLDAAWSEMSTVHDLSNSDVHYSSNYSGLLNMTTSYGILFMNSMFKASDPTIDSMVRTYIEQVDDNAFVMRDPENGLNMDLMTYSMYTLAAKDPDALLDYNTFVAHANRTFQTFFQHFIRTGMSLTEGGLAYQKIGDTSYEDLGAAVDIDGAALPLRDYRVVDANRTVEAVVSNRIQVLHMNPVATYLSASLLIWLIGTTAVMTCLQRKYTGSMVRDVQLIADVLVIVAGSEKFLDLVHERGTAVKKEDKIETMLGWFRGADGQIRWGIELVGGRDPVEWVDAPKSGWHVQAHKFLGTRMFPWFKG